MTAIRPLSLCLVLAAVFGAVCGTTVRNEAAARDNMPIANINDVLRAHDDELLAIPGVVGVYVGLLDDNKTPCIKIMVVEKTPALVEKLPKSLDGHPVVVEESGIIRPMGER